MCWIDIPGGGGTGFLVGPDLVLTNQHVIDRVASNQARWQDVPLPVRLPSAVVAALPSRKEVTEVELAEQWLVRQPSPSRYDWNPTLGDASAGKPTARSSGLRTRSATCLGGMSTDPEAEPRRWIDTTVEPAPLTVGNQVFVLQHPRKPLQLTVGTVTEFNTAGTRVRYDANSKDGSSGSPCFDADLQLVALHHAHDPPIRRRGTRPSHSRRSRRSGATLASSSLEGRDFMPLTSRQILMAEEFDQQWNLAQPQKAIFAADRLNLSLDNLAPREASRTALWNLSIT